MNYTVYEITNLINNKIYIGQHKTDDIDDGYMGSGFLLNKAIIKYGIENFKKEILHIFDNEEDMCNKEAELVTREFCLREDTYNLKNGGKGNWSYINDEYWTIEKRQKHNKKASPFGTEEFIEDNKKAFSAGGINNFNKNGIPQKFNRTGHKNTPEQNAKIGLAASISQMGEKNSQYGIKRKWITDGMTSKRIKREEEIPLGWRPGRK